MIDIALQAVANQQFTIQLDGARYDLTIKETSGCMSATILRDGVTLLSMVRIVAGAPLIPYAYQQDGNFVITVLDEQLPDWPLFGVSQFLVYVSAAEIEALRGT